jgi:apolipoprotein N-acyltransferase
MAFTPADKPPQVPVHPGSIAAVNARTERMDGRTLDDLAEPDTSEPAGSSMLRRGGGWTVFGAGLASGLLWWLALPPVGWSVLGIFAPVPLLGLVSLPRLPGRRPYWSLWAAASVSWLVYLQGVRLAHPALYAGWLALSIYVAAYTPAFVALTRIAAGRLGWPLPLAAPVIWVALELVRGHFLGGFSGGMLGHTQVKLPWILQMADLGGAYLLSAWVMFVAACLWQAGTQRSGHGTRRWWRYWAAVAGAVLAACGYGAWRLGQSPVSDSEGPARPRIALIQESIDTVFEYNPRRNSDAFQRYLERTLAACAEHGPLDAAVWPESMFTENTPELLWTAAASVDVPVELRAGQAAFSRKAGYVMGRLETLSPGTMLIAGSTTVELDGVGLRDFNSAIMLSAGGAVADRYHKRHLVMFGEYIPLGDWFPWLYWLAGMPGELKAGTVDKAFAVKSWRLAPSVCFESMVPHLMRRKIDALEAGGTPIDAQVNITNDGWFWGSALLDMHLQAGVLRAVELRRPFLVAANTGLSAWVDSDGRVVAVGPRRAGATLIATPHSDRRRSPYRTIGDLPWWLCVAATAYVAAAYVAAAYVPAAYVPAAYVPAAYVAAAYVPAAAVKDKF